ncbi:MAG TPA: DNA polymerase III subunit gamma/tau [Bacteroidales bacterium]|nr:DNA polymerase III subunit gamma/tau [Bacteroidales bacterium]
MDNFIVSARKYRPATFDMVVGQSSVVSTLKNAIRTRQIAHAYLFCGPRGVGKTTCARIFAKTINCLNITENGEACDKCESCVSFNSLRSFNIHELDAASNNKVEDIRLLTDQVRIPPQIGKFSIYIIDEVHMLSSAAFNAFLKTLEEPPAHAIFILATTEKHKIIPTILSRCQIFDFQRIRIEDMVARLKYVADNESVKADEHALHIIAQKADGAMRDALSIFDQIVSYSGREITYEKVIENLNVLDYEYYFRTVDAALEGNVSKILLIFNDVIARGFDGHNFIAGLNSHLRNLLVSKDEATITLLDTAPTVRENYIRQARKCTREFLYQALETGSTCDTGYKTSRNQRLHVEITLVRLCRLNAAENQVEEKKKPELKPEKSPPEPVAGPNPGLYPKVAEKPKKIPGNEKPVPESKEEEKRSVSIKDLLSSPVDENSKPEEYNGVDSDTVQEQSRTGFAKLTGGEFEKAWKTVCEKFREEGPRISGMFKSITPEVHNDNVVTLHMNNIPQRDLFINNYKLKVISMLEEVFGRASFTMEVAVDNSESEGIIYSDEQKYNYLSSRYPMIKELRKTFNLDFE